MSRIRTFWAPLLLCGLLVATLVGAVSARPNSAPLSSTTSTLTMAASDCYPYSDDAEYDNDGWRLSTGGTTWGNYASFLCPVRFPEYGTHTISSVTMYAYDDKSGSGDDDMVCAEVNRTYPPTKTEKRMGEVCSTGDNDTDPRSFTISGTQINPNTVQPTYGMHFWVTMGELKLRLYGFSISYSVSTP
jgi:hypothetical protein